MAPFCYPSERRKYGTDYRPCRSYSFKMAYLYRRGSIYICRNRRGFTQHDHPDRQKKRRYVWTWSDASQQHYNRRTSSRSISSARRTSPYQKRKHRSDRSNGSRRSSCKTQRRDGTSKRIYHREKRHPKQWSNCKTRRLDRCLSIRVRQCYRRKYRTDFGTGSRKSILQSTRRRRCI